MTEERNSAITCIFFDLDNTLIETRKADSKACNKLSQILFEQYGIAQEKASSACSNFLRNFRKCPDNSAMDLNSWRTLLWAEALDDQFESITDAVYQHWLQLRYKYLALSSDVKSVLLNLRKYYFIGLITNGPSAAQWEKVEKLKLKNFFDTILVSGDLPWEKPHSGIFHEACEYLGVEPQKCIMVGDKLETDILGGIKADLGGTVWLPLNDPTLDRGDPNPDYIIKNITDLIGLLPKHNSPLGFRSKMANYTRGFNKLSVCDVDDCNSNSSDGS